MTAARNESFSSREARTDLAIARLLGKFGLRSFADHIHARQEEQRQDLVRAYVASATEYRQLCITLRDLLNLVMQQSNESANRPTSHYVSLIGDFFDYAAAQNLISDDERQSLQVVQSAGIIIQQRPARIKDIAVRYSVESLGRPPTKVTLVTIYDLSGERVRSVDVFGGADGKTGVEENESEAESLTVGDLKLTIKAHVRAIGAIQETLNAAYSCIQSSLEDNPRVLEAHKLALLTLATERYTFEGSVR